MPAPQPLKLLVEGWRLLPHSYAIVNQFQCLELLRRPHVTLWHRDMPLFSANWAQVSGLWEPADEAAIRGIAAPPPGARPDAILRIDFPHRLEAVPGVRTAVFMTAEFRILPDVNIAGQRPLGEWHRESDVVLITPSEWSRQGLLASGADAARVFVVPHGVEPRIFRPLPAEERAALRRQMGVDGFYFLNLGGMTGNKNIPLLLKAFAFVANRHPQARLALKGIDALYRSQQLVAGSAGLLTPAEVQVVQPRVTYVGATLPFGQVCQLYQALDAYVSPYAGEGFNLPVLEAAACGMPVICTAGGATDDFTAPEFALRIDAGVSSAPVEGQTGTILEASLESLVSHMLRVIEVPEVGAGARVAGPAFVARGFHWRQVVDRLLAVLSPPR